MHAPVPAAAKLPPLFKVDNLLPDQARGLILKTLNSGRWTFGWKSSAKTDEFSFWHQHFAGHRNARGEKAYDCSEELRQTSLPIFLLWQHLRRRIFTGHTLIRCYANAQSYGTDGTIHVDSKSPTSRTAVYYPHETWQPNWAGETVVFNRERSDIVAAFYPRPNRLTVFQGALPHVARGVSRTCPKLRITLMFKCDSEAPDERASPAAGNAITEPERGSAN